MCSFVFCIVICIYIYILREILFNCSLISIYMYICIYIYCFQILGSSLPRPTALESMLTILVLSKVACL